MTRIIKVPTLWRDGIHDDTEALQAKAAGKLYHDRVCGWIVGGIPPDALIETAAGGPIDPLRAQADKLEHES